jgi:Protein of unknown function (DUF3151)
MTDQPVPLSSGLPETELPAPPDDWASALTAARRLGDTGEREAATRAAAAAHPRHLDAWADLAELAAGAGDHVAAYAFARVGYHRGLDALRGAGWRGSGYVRWAHGANQGFLRSLAALGAAAAAIGEEDEAERCAVFLGQLDPRMPRADRAAAAGAAEGPVS